MLRCMFGLKQPIFGLDIGFRTMKMVQLKGHGHSANLWGAIEVPISEMTLSKNGVRDPNNLAKMISHALHQAKPNPINAINVSLSLPDSLVFTKTFEMNKSSTTEIKRQVMAQVHEFFPMPQNEIIIDWHITNSVMDKSEIIVVASPKIVIDKLCEVVKLAGLNPVSIESSPFATARALIDKHDQKTYLLIDIATENSVISIIGNQTIKLTTTLKIGGDDLQSNFAAGIKTLCSEISHLVNYHKNQTNSLQPEKIMLSGGGANITKTADLIEEITKIKTIIAPPKVNIMSFNPKFTTAVGLAMKKI